MVALLFDIRIAWRGTWAARRTLLPSVLVSGLILGVVAATVAVVDATLIRALGFPQSDRLVAIGRVSEASPEYFGVSLPDYLDWRDRADGVLQDAGLYQRAIVAVVTPDGPIEL